MVLVSSLHIEHQSQQGVTVIHTIVPSVADLDAVRRFFCPSLRETKLSCTDFIEIVENQKTQSQ